MQMSGWLHAPATLSPRKSGDAINERRIAGFWVQSLIKPAPEEREFMRPQTYQNLGTFWKLQAPQQRHDSSSILTIHKSTKLVKGANWRPEFVHLYAKLCSFLFV